MHSIAGLNCSKICQNAISELEGFDRAGVHGIIVWRIVATRNQNDLLIVRRRANLVRIFSGIERVRLVYAFSDRAVAIETMHGNRAWVVIRDKQVFAHSVYTCVDGP